MPALTKQTFQHGSLTIESRNRKPNVWIYRWREAGANGTRVKRKKIIGTVEVLRTKAAAQRAVDGLQLEINVEAPIVAQRNLTLAEVVSHFKETELAPGNSRKSPSTKVVYRMVIDHYILPQWGKALLRDLRPVSVENWLEGLPHAPGTRAKIRNILSALFQHSIRQGWSETNPIRAVRCSAKRQAEPEILEPEEIRALLTELPEPVCTMVLIAATTGLRVSEILGLQWQDVDLESAVIHLRRGVVNQEISSLKTIGSRKPVPLAVALVVALKDWQKQTSFAAPSNWVFASPSIGGKQPYWPGILLVRHVRPAASRLGISKRIGWHSFRRAYATLLYSNEQDVKISQELMRHSNPSVTMGVYAQAITERKRAVQERLAVTILSSTPTEQVTA